MVEVKMNVPQSLIDDIEFIKLDCELEKKVDAIAFAIQFTKQILSGFESGTIKIKDKFAVREFKFTKRGKI